MLHYKDRALLYVNDPCPATCKELSKILNKIEQRKHLEAGSDQATQVFILPPYS